MKLISELEKQDKANSDYEYRNLDSVKAGKYKMSVQASTGHYCSPRMTLPVGCYTHMELAIFNKRGWLHITRISVLKAFPRYNELLGRADNVNSPAPVFGFVPVDLLDDLYMYLCGA